MSDEFLTRLQEPPHPGFAEALRARLDTVEEEDGANRAERRRVWTRLRPLLVGVLAIAAVGAALSVPAVRASARSLLEIFRIKRFTAVPVDVGRLSKLHDQNLDFKALLASQVEMLEEPGEPQIVPDSDAAEEMAGMPVAQPSRLATRCSLSEIRVGGRAAFRATFDASKLELLAQALDVPDLDIPYELNGATVAVETSPVVVMTYTRDKDQFHFFQARSPEVELPPGVELERLGAIGLRLAGMSSEEAQIFARKIDWRTTMLVPVPVTGGDFRDVEVGDAQGLLVSSRRVRPAQDDGVPQRARWHSMLLWSKAGKVFALEGPGRGVELLEMADSIG